MPGKHTTGLLADHTEHLLMPCNEIASSWSLTELHLTPLNYDQRQHASSNWPLVRFSQKPPHVTVLFHCQPNQNGEVVLMKRITQATMAGLPCCSCLLGSRNQCFQSFILPFFFAGNNYPPRKSSSGSSPVSRLEGLKIYFSPRA